MTRLVSSLATLLAFTAAAAEPVDYLKDIKPVLAARCYACHGALKQKAGLRLDTAPAIHKGGENGPAITSAKPLQSLLLKRVTTTDADDRMPPEGEPLTPAQIAKLTAWLQQGAPAPATEQADEDPAKHWAFVPPVRPPVPVIRNSKFEIRNSIDSFIAAELAQRGLTPQPPADRAVLLRRVYLDLIGLPPTRAELAMFLADTSAKAYEQVVERLLASPQYGERWGRHWMDVWRYSDWYGLGAQLRYSQKHIWRWRDWIIESLNADRGYDRMIREMLAGDELAPTDPDVLRATGFLARNYYLFNRTTWLDELVEHTGKAFLGVTLNCAKCHDHKFDPFTHVDYYRFRAIFEPHQIRLDSWPGQTDLEKDGLPRAFDLHTNAPTWLHVRGDDRQPDKSKSKSIAPGLPTVLLRGEFDIKPVALPLESFAPSLRPAVQQDLVRQAEEQITTARAALVKAKEALAKAQANKPAEPQPAVKTELEKDLADIAADSFQLKEDFATLKPALWKLGDGEWKHEAGKLAQKRVSDTRGFARLLKTVPADFTAKVRFVIKGGSRYRSVGLCFDVADGKEKLVYLSASEGAKVQISYKEGAAHVYPPGAMQARRIVVNETYELAVSVRGQVMNVAVNGEHAVAYRLPVTRLAGGFDLITYDAAAEFLSVEIADLPATAKLIEPGGPAATPAAPATPAPVTTVEDAQAAVTLAEKAIAAAELRPAAVRAALAADTARLHNPPAENAKALAQAAAKAEKMLAAAKAEEDLLRAEDALRRGVAGKTKKDAPSEKKVADARAALEKARKAVDAPGESYTSPRMSRKAFEGPTETDAMLPSVFPPTSTGRRTALANWIASRANPLTARVAVNQMWSRHFGEPLAPSVFDLGRKSAPPTHPALLDWLAVEFMEHGWSMKHLHRLMVTSAAYQRSSAAADVRRLTSTPNSKPETRNSSQSLLTSAATADPDNRYLWRMNSRRMESQVVRDSVLHLAGELDLKLGGPTVDPKADTSLRRSLYFTHSLEDQHRFLTMFDDAKILECYRRQESIVPQQALAMSNSKLGLGAAPKIVARIEKELSGGTDAQFIRAAFEAILATPPTLAEQSECEQALAGFAKLQEQKKAAQPAQRARVNLVHALLNHNDFVTIR